jgi:hypothetical protein
MTDQARMSYRIAVGTVITMPDDGQPIYHEQATSTPATEDEKTKKYVLGMEKDEEGDFKVATSRPVVREEGEGHPLRRPGRQHRARRMLIFVDRILKPGDRIRVDEVHIGYNKDKPRATCAVADVAPSL